ncbi:MAG: hypothetical protein ABW019_15755 [Chitinophagaceae bacterium]
MKKILPILLIACSCFTASAQIMTTLSLNPTPPATLSDWNIRKEILVYLCTLDQPAGGSITAKVKTELKLTDGTVIATTDLARSKTIVFNSGTTILSAVDVVPLEAMVFTGKYQSVLERTGKLMPGTYQLVVQLVRPADFVPVSDQRSRIFTVAALQLPIAVMPANGTELEAAKAQTAITFRWTPLTPRTQELPRYRVQVFEVQENQTPMQAFRSNQPLLDREVTGTTQFIWQPQLTFIKTNLSDSTGESTKQTFIWTIQTLDNTGRPIGDGNVNGDGRSEPVVFSVVSKPGTNPLKPGDGNTDLPGDKNKRL